jgi:hypothetical protein
VPVKTKKTANKKKVRATIKAPARRVKRTAAKKHAAPRAAKQPRAKKSVTSRPAAVRVKKTGPAVKGSSFVTLPKKTKTPAVKPKAAPQRAAAAAAVRKKTVGGAILKPAEKPTAPGFALDREPAMGPKYFFSTEIPGAYDETYMRALPKDPLWVFAYWELSGETIELMRRHVGAEVFNSSKWVLRVLDVSDIFYNGTNAWRQMDIALAPYATSWYVKVWEPGRTYLLQCGIVTPDSRFYSAVNSNPVQTPRSDVSPVLDEEWMTASTDELIRLSGLKRGFGSSENSSGSSAAGLASGSGSGSGSML